MKVLQFFPPEDKVGHAVELSLFPTIQATDITTGT
jgi:hypothetical protein